MPRSKSLLARPWHWLKLVFATRVRVQRRGKHLQVVFEDTAYRSTQAHSAARELPPADAAARHMHSALKALLDQYGHARRVMRHLRLLESQLKRSGAKAFDELPADALKTALLQLDSLVADRSAPGLAALRTRLAASISEPEPEAAADAQSSKLSDFCNSRRMQVRELSHSDFEDMAKSWLGRQPDMAPKG